jgi:hypothetical protein
MPIFEGSRIFWRKLSKGFEPSRASNIRWRFRQPVPSRVADQSPAPDLRERHSVFELLAMTSIDLENEALGSFSRII